MKVIYDHTKGGLRLLRCFGDDGQAGLPDQIDGQPVTELGPYVFAETVRKVEPGEAFLAEVWEAEGVAAGRRENANAGAGRKEDGFGNSLRIGRTIGGTLITGGKWAGMEALEDGTPVLSGARLRSLVLPSELKKIGAYACYNCENLEELTFSWELTDLGAGLFTGCHRIHCLKLCMPFGHQSCLKEVLAELRQTLQVIILDGRGQVQAKLLFPEYYEEAIENTPARILTQEMHGCGHRYRNAFSGREFQYLAYDRLFPHIQVQEKPELVMELVLGRLMYPIQLQKERREIYEEYAAAHGRQIVRAAAKEQDMGMLRFAANASWCSNKCLEEMLEESSLGKDAQAMGLLMDIRHGRKKRDDRESSGDGIGNRGWDTEWGGEGNENNKDNHGSSGQGSRGRRRFEL